MPKQIPIRVNSLDTDMEFTIMPSTTARQLFDQVAKTLEIREVWYFGLQMIDSEGKKIWLKHGRRVLYQINKYQSKTVKDQKAVKQNGKQSDSTDVKKGPLATLMFLVKFYPEDVAQELIQEITQKLFFLQVKQAILDGEIHCSPETAVLLASYAAQVKHGDFESTNNYEDFNKVDQWLPGKIILENKLTMDQWQERILIWYAEHKGMMKEDAMMEYLKVAQDLDMFGVNYFEVRNKKNSVLLLGVDALGLTVYDKQNKLAPCVGFQWSEIRHLNSHNKKFLIKPVDKKSPDFVFFSPSKRMNKQILLLAAGNHQLFKKRREDESLEINQMRLHAKAEKSAKLAERQTLCMERMQRMELERNKTELEDRLHRYQSQYHLAIQELEKTRESNLHLNHKIGESLDDVDAAVEKSEKQKSMESEEIEEKKMLKEKINFMKQEIEERKKILEMIFENAKSTSKRGETVKNLLKAYTMVLSSGKKRKSSQNEDFYALRERIEVLTCELSDMTAKTQEARKNIANIKMQQANAIDKNEIMKMISEDKY